MLPADHDFAAGQMLRGDVRLHVHVFHRPDHEIDAVVRRLHLRH
jgi:hypothetical protein